MGIYLNPGKQLFTIALNSPVYVDKTGMVAELNALVNTERRYVCVSRPRRFGKSMGIAMLAAYYGKGAESRGLFEGRKLAQIPSWDAYLENFDVICLTMTDFLQPGRTVRQTIRIVTERILEELAEISPETEYDAADFSYSLAKFSKKAGRQFVILIDEWDAVFRECPDDHAGHREYLDFLRNWLKDKPYVALAYMTGILPIKKYGRHSALNMFTEYSMTGPLQFAPYTGFTAEEVRALCQRAGRPFGKMEEWYDGYRVCGPIAEDPQETGKAPARYHLYAPLSVVNAIQFGFIRNYWNATETFEALAMYIRMDYDGLKETVAELMDGKHLPVSLDTYQNDMTTFECRDDILALLVHLGYLGYDQLAGEVFIPNREVREVFDVATRGPEWSSTMRALRNSQRLLEATWAGDAETVAGLLEAAHDQAGNRTYNSEAALSYAVQLAYYKAQDEYTLIPELDTGRGYADLVYLPKSPGRPALLVELKYRQDADTAIAQIQRQKYPARLEHYKGNLILVGISYDRDADPKRPNFKHHACQLSRA